MTTNVLSDFYTAFAPSCFSLLALWLAIVGFNARDWLSSDDARQRDARQKQVYAVAQFFAAPGTMSVLALINLGSSTVWRVAFALISVLGLICVWLFGPVHHNHTVDHKSDTPLQFSDHVVYWGTYLLYLAILVLAIIPESLLEYEGILLTVLMLTGVHVELRLMLTIHDPAKKGKPGDSAGQGGTAASA
jgi:dipeptide/tripeptide permease